ncbi:MAG: Gfo/Idh/MocA family oxidoreductase [Paraburkholderia sp.]|uniref:Gfo/Idh/MocA family protein n=1 Tax=Paraburkholderia sp. TaxID=1926495 RepID=UPI001214C14B|nr:Gfo/Idh/MocA family oxidoreductase [Paraburkholderia sp.]TAM03372.1 MAG: Gfo/Idh/MocA family oxidoreductase [Paraburkholderia sp.]TAM30026.1 MAG: Gfo/Idh/MocA family oxidoreductase [Paraburkholderia sp.]
MPKDVIVWGILGTGKINDKVVVPMNSAPQCRVKGIASRDPQKAREAAAKYGLPVAYDSYEALLADPEIDAVYIPLPNHIHVEWAIKSVDAGKHVLCEKPIGLNAEQAAQLVAARDRSGRYIQEAFMVRTHPQWLKVRALIDEGAIGELRAITGGFTYSNTNPHDIRNQSELGGGGLLDIGCYPITTSRFVIGREPRRVVALMERDPAFEVDRLGSVMMDFDGVQASFFYSTQIHPYQRMQFHGTAGRIEVEIPFNAPNDQPTRLLVSERTSARAIDDRWVELPACDQYGVAAAVFAQAILSGGPQAIPLDDACANMRVIDAVFQSAQLGGWVSIPER